MKLLSIQVPTICSRLKEFTLLHDFLQKQVQDDKLEKKVEIIFERDNKEISIGAKRQKLYEKAKAKFSVQIDDDDWVAKDYIRTIVNIIEQYPKCDAIGYLERCEIDNRVEIAMHSNNFSDWATKKNTGNGDFGLNIKHERTLFFKDPILTEYCLAVGVHDIRFSEDHRFAREMKAAKLIQEPIFIEKIMYIYKYKAEPHNSKYGIK